MNILDTDKGPILIRGLRCRDSEDLADMMSLPGVTYGLSSMPYTNEYVVKSLMNDPANKHWLIAEYNGKAVGFLYLQWTIGRWRRVASIAMGVHDSFAGNGIGRELVEQALHVGFLYLDFERIELVVYQDNGPAVAIYEKCGLKIEGKREEQVIREGVYYDSFLMGITRHQYEQIQKLKLLKTNESLKY